MFRSALYTQYRQFATKSSETVERGKLLTSIYHDAFKGPKLYSPEWKALTETGKIWENHFQPFNTKKWQDAQKTWSFMLDEIDARREILRSSDWTRRLTMMLINDFVHERAQRRETTHIETEKIVSELAPYVHGLLRNKMISIMTMLNVSCVIANSLKPTQKANENIPLRNHIMVSKAFIEKAMREKGGPGLDIDDLKKIARITLRATEAETAVQLRNRILDREHQQTISDFRKFAVQLGGHHMLIHPYPFEIPAIMYRLLEYRKENPGNLHPLVLAMHVNVALGHIQPFVNGNKRISRAVTADILVRNGLLPRAFENLDRAEYTSMLVEAMLGDVEGICGAAVMTQLNTLRILDF
jgi:hypothetical protein